MTALPPELTIDDLTFVDLLKIALDDLPGASAGAWTMHGPLDPGITLLELFAWRLEQRLFAAEQVTEPVVRSGLRLLGLGDLAPGRAARTVVSLRGGGAVRTLAAGSVLQLQDDDMGRRFTTEHDVDVLPVHGIETLGTPRVPGDVLALRLDRDGPIVGEATLTLLLLMPSRGAARPVWEAPANPEEAVPPPVDLEWTATGPDGSSRTIPVEDGTGGLRRSGLLRVPWPSEWDRVGGHGCLLRATVRDGFLTEPAQVRAVHPNAVIARHLVRAEADVSAQAAQLTALPGQRLRLPQAAGALYDAPGATTLRLDEVDGQAHDWASVPGWAGVDPGDRVFTVDRARGDLLFGDGRAGRVPRPAAGGRAVVRYLLGAGPDGNLGSSRTWAQQNGAESGVNPVPASGGTDAEGVEAGRQRAADELGRPDRTVTKDDVRDLALTTPGVDVRRVLVSVDHHPDFPCTDVPGALTVTVVPGADRDAPVTEWVRTPTPDPGLIEAVRRRLDKARLLGQEVFVGPPHYRAVRVGVELTRSATDDAVAAQVTDALIRHLDPLNGGADHAGRDFGEPLRPSELLGVAGRAAGPEATVTALSVAVDDGAAIDCGEITLGPRELAWLDEVQVSRATVVPSGGGLQ